MNLTNKSYLESNPFNTNIKSKEDLIETLLISLDNSMSSIKYKFGDKIKLSKSVYDGGFLVSNFIGNDLQTINSFEYELDFDLLELSEKQINLPVFHLHSHQHHHFFEILYRKASRKSTFVDLIACNFRSKKILSPKNKNVLCDFALFQDNDRWYCHRNNCMLEKRSADFIMKHRVNDRENDLKEYKQKLDKILSDKENIAILNQLNSERKQNGLPPVTDALLIHEDSLTLKCKTKKDFMFPALYSFSAFDKYVRKLNKRFSFSLTEQLQDHLSLYLEEFYKWHIYIKTIDGKLGFQIPFIFDELDSIYTLKELPKTKTGRNKKIIHWVCGHTRKIKIKDKSGNEIGKREIWIKRFLRGENVFKWNGVSVAIMPSGYDLKRFTGVKRKFDIKNINKKIAKTKRQTVRNDGCL